MFHTTRKKGNQYKREKKSFIKKSEKNAYCYLLLRIQVAKSLKTTSSHFLDGDDFFLTRYKLRADFTRFVSFPLELVCGASLSNLCFFFLLPSIYCSLVRVVAYFLSSKLCSFFVVTDLDRFLSHLYYWNQLPPLLFHSTSNADYFPISVSSAY